MDPDEAGVADDVPEVWGGNRSIIGCPLLYVSLIIGSPFLHFSVIYIERTNISLRRDGIERLLL